MSIPESQLICLLPKFSKDCLIDRFDKAIREDSVEKLLTYCGYINFAVWCILKHYNCTYKEEYKDEYDIWVIHNVRGLFNNPDIEIQLTNVALSRYVKQYWPGAYHSTPTLNKVRDKFRELKIFNFEDQPIGARRGGREETVYTPPVLRNVDLVAMLLFWKRCEYRLMELCPHRPVPYNDDKDLPECYPEHGAYLLQNMYETLNAFIQHVMEENDPDWVEGMLEAEDYPEILDLAQRWWVDIIIERAKAIVAPLYRFATRCFKKLKQRKDSFKDLRDTYTRSQIEAIPY